jgi:hypothetical protein
MRPPIYSSGVRSWLSFVLQLVWHPYPQTLLLRGARGLLSATGSADMSATGPMTTLQLVSHSGSGCISAWGRSCASTVRTWDAT